MDISYYWKTSLDDINIEVGKIKKGKTRILGYSAGKREIQVVEYGEKENLKRTANYSSACGGKDPSAYAHRDGIKPIISLIGGIHGGEMEGIAGIINLINIIETGADLRGKHWDYIYENYNRVRLIIIPCMNPDGRAKIPFDSFIGRTFEDVSYYTQGVWNDGTACIWPSCKTIHPIKNAVKHLGGYYNDDGVNLMHDNFFMPMAEETKILMKITDNEAPDFTALLHGGGNYPSHLYGTNYSSIYIKEKTQEFSRRLEKHYNDCGLLYAARDLTQLEGDSASFNLDSALHHLCGGIGITFESNVGIDVTDEWQAPFSADEILDSHLILFEEIMRFILKDER